MHRQQGQRASGSGGQAAVASFHLQSCRWPPRLLLPPLMQLRLWRLTPAPRGRLLCQTSGACHCCWATNWLQLSSFTRNECCSAHCALCRRHNTSEARQGGHPMWRRHVRRGPTLGRPFRLLTVCALPEFALSDRKWHTAFEYARAAPPPGSLRQGAGFGVCSPSAHLAIRSDVDCSCGAVSADTSRRRRQGRWPGPAATRSTGH